MDALLSWITDKLSYVIDVIMLALPNSPFQSLTVSSAVSPLLGMLNWALPISEIVLVLEAWVICVSVFYVYQLILRWAKAIQ